MYDIAASNIFAATISLDRSLILGSREHWHRTEGDRFFVLLQPRFLVSAHNAIV